MVYTYQRSYRGRLQAVILDWTGTMVDFGALATIEALVHAFEASGVPVSSDEARQFTGLDKRQHLERVTRMASVHRRWIERHGRGAAPTDVDALHKAFCQAFCHVLNVRAVPVPGAVDVVGYLSAAGYRLASNTACGRADIEPHVAALLPGGRPQSISCADDVPVGRPAPHMSLRNAIELQVDTVQACVKVDDTIPGIEEGLNAGMWTVAVAVSGNEVGLPLAAWQALTEAQREACRDHAYHRLRMAGAHYVVDTVADLPGCLAAIEERMQRGDRP